MAERQRFLSSDFGKESASDAVYDHECDACRFKGTISEGTSFCNVCREFLCDECKRVHRNSRATRDHDLVDVDSLYQVQVQGSPQPRDVTSVSAASAGVQSSREADQFMEKINSMNARIIDLCDEKNGYLVQLDKDKRDILQEITDIRDGINALLDRLEKEMRHTVISKVTKETNKIQGDLSALNTIKSSLDDYTKNMDAAKSTGNNEMLFAMKRAGLHELESPLDDIDEGQCMVKMNFTSHHLLREILSSVHSFGSLDIKSPKRPGNLLPVSLRDRALVEEDERHIEQQDEKSFCSITGSIFLPSGKSLICDFKNVTVKLLSTDMAVQAVKKMSSRPFDVAMVTENEVVISLPKEKKLQYVTVPGLKPGRKVKVGRYCWGLAVQNDRIFVTCHDDPGNGEVLLLTKSGALQRRIGRTGDGSYRFTSPTYIAVDAFGEKIYVSDNDLHSVTCLTREGGPVYHCVLGEAVRARNLLVDSEGGVLVCSRDSSTASLQFLTPDGNHYRTLETWPRETWNPFTFCYRSRDRTLLLGMWENNKMLVYRFE